MAREKIKTSREEIVNYWSSRVCESDLGIDWAEAHERCWRCAYESSLERCHIIPVSLGGDDIASNFVLLCKRCHIENPNISNKKIMWDWLKAHGVTFYDTYWIIRGQEEYEKIYGINYNKESNALMTKIFGATIDNNEIHNSYRNEIEGILKSKMKETSYHFGHPYLNSATLAGLLRIGLEEMAKRYNSEITPRPSNNI